MASKLGNLQSALNKTRAPIPAANDAPAVIDRPTVTPSAAPRQSNREGKVNLSSWLDAGFKSSLRLVQARRPGSIQDLMEEALNDLFAKYDVPQVTAEDRR